MKKLLYTLLFGLVIVSCQKEEYGGNYAPNALSADVEVTIDKQGILDAVERLSTVTNKGGVSTRRANASSYIKLVLGVSSGYYYEFAWDQANDDSCIDASHGFTTIFMDLNNDNGLDVYLSDDFSGSPFLIIDGSFAPIFTLSFRNGWQIALDGTEETSSPTSGNQFTF